MSAVRTAPPQRAAPSEPAARPGRAALRRARSRRTRSTAVLLRYLGYAGYFVGAGLISGAVVHHLLDPARYTRIALYGVLVFLTATALNDFVLARPRPAVRRMAAVMAASLLSFGIDMLRERKPVAKYAGSITEM